MNKKKDISWIVGIDEAGRGPLAGPIYVGVFAIPIEFDPTLLDDVRDSKVLSPHMRTTLYRKLTSISGCRHAVAFTNPYNIDKKGITWSTKSALERALQKIAIDPAHCKIYLDGGLKAPDRFVYQETVVKGDSYVPIISAASILAKVSRDKKMCVLSRKYNVYKFEQHKGYGTRMHREKIQQYGLCDIHRKTFCKNFTVSGTGKK